VIISEPSNPWMVGVGSIFSREFYELAASRLQDSGVICQWFHVYEMSDAIVSLVLRTFSSVFPNVEIWDVGGGDILMLGARRRFESSPKEYREIFERAEVRKDLEAIGVKTPEALWARQLASQDTAFAIPGDGPLQSDVFPILEYEAPKAFYLGGWSALLVLLDERTWQWELASESKAKVLSTMDVAVLRDVFGRYTSVNAQLNQILVARFEAADHHRTSQGAGIPCLFETQDPASFKVDVPPGTSAEWKRLLEAEAAIRANVASWLEPVTTIQNALSAGNLNAAVRVAGRSPTDLAVRAAKECLRHGDRQRAEILGLAGLQLDPQSAELRYTGRVLRRERAAVSTVAR